MLKLKFKQTRMKNLKLMSAALALLFLGGCRGDDGHAETFPARGSLMVNGQPAAGALITLHTTGEKVDSRNSSPWAKVQEDGTFELMTYEPGDGAPAGTYQATIVWPFDSTKPSPADKLGRAFATVAQSRWKFSIEPGENELTPIEIDDVVVAEQAPEVPLRIQQFKGPPM